MHPATEASILAGWDCPRCGQLAGSGCLRMNGSQGARETRHPHGERLKRSRSAQPDASFHVPSARLTRAVAVISAALRAAGARATGPEVAGTFAVRYPGGGELWVTVREKGGQWPS